MTQAQLMRIMVPLEFIQDNPFQVREEYGDIANFAEQEIAPLFEQRAGTLGLITVPQARLVSPAGVEAVPEVFVVTHKLRHIQAPLFRVSQEALRQAWRNAGAVVQLVFGHRRVEALRHLAKSADPRYSHGFVPLDLVCLDDTAMLQHCWLENAARKETTVLENLAMIEQALKVLGDDTSLADVGRLLGISRTRVSNILRLRSASPALRQALDMGTLSGAVLEELNKLEEMIPHLRMEGFLPEPTPRQFLAEALEGSRLVTRDAVRRYIASLGDRSQRVVFEPWLGQVLDGQAFKGEVGGEAGEGAIETDAEGNIAETAQVVRPKCNLCPARVEMKCLNAPCWRTKRELAGRQLAAQLVPQRPWGKEECFSVTWLTERQAMLLALYLDTPSASMDDPRLVVGVAKAYGFGLLVHGRTVAYLRPEKTNPRETLVYSWAGSPTELEEALRQAGVDVPLPTPIAAAMPAATWASKAMPTTAPTAAEAARVDQLAEIHAHKRPAVHIPPMPLDRREQANRAWAGIDFDQYTAMAKEVVSRVKEDATNLLERAFSRDLFRPQGGSGGLPLLSKLLLLDHNYRLVQETDTSKSWEDGFPRLVRTMVSRYTLGSGPAVALWEMIDLLPEPHLLVIPPFEQAMACLAQAPLAKNCEHTAFRQGSPKGDLEGRWLFVWGPALLANHDLPPAIQQDLRKVLAHWGIFPQPTLMELFADDAAGDGSIPTAQVQRVEEVVVL